MACGILGEDPLDPSAERRPGERLLDRDVPAQPARRRRAGPAGVHQPLAARHLGARAAQLSRRGLLPPPLHQGDRVLSRVWQHLPPSSSQPPPTVRSGVLYLI